METGECVEHIPDSSRHFLLIRSIVFFFIEGAVLLNYFSQITVCSDGRK